MVGSIVLAGAGQSTVTAVCQALEAKDRTAVDRQRQPAAFI